MSAYPLNEIIREVNRAPERRELFFTDTATFAAGCALNREDLAAIRS